MWDGLSLLSIPTEPCVSCVWVWISLVCTETSNNKQNVLKASLERSLFLLGQEVDGEELAHEPTSICKIWHWERF